MKTKSNINIEKERNKKKAIRDLNVLFYKLSEFGITKKEVQTQVDFYFDSTLINFPDTKE